MRLESLQISNIWSFGYHSDIADAPLITFNEKLNLLIGQNGAGKSTVLEVINFLFRRVLYPPFFRDRDLYLQRLMRPEDQRKSILVKQDFTRFYREFQLDRNFDFENETQKIRIRIRLDDIDKANIKHLQDNGPKLISILTGYSNEHLLQSENYQEVIQIDVELKNADKTFSVNANQDIAYRYLSAYNLYKETIDIYNEENPSNPIANLAESFAIIGSYRNYNSYTSTASLAGNRAERQIQQIRTGEFSKSMNSSDNSEPTIFSLVRLQMAGECFKLIPTNMSQEETESAANDLPFVRAINEKLKIVDLAVKIQLVELENWSFSFSLLNTRRNRLITNIGSLSAGQKAIVHLVFEAYGRGNLNGGLVIIDEPEIHLHYQFQNEYLRVIEKLNQEQSCQYILVTHSESLISSQTIESVIRLSIDSSGYTKINQPEISTEERWLVKILDNKRSTHAFFGSKVLLVEGDTDRYFFRALLSEIEQKSKLGLVQEIAILDIDGKKSEDWRQLFQSFGLEVFFETDLDSSWRFFTNETPYKLNTPSLVATFLNAHTDVISRIEAEYPNNTYILKEGDLEAYLGIDKGLAHVIAFCQGDLRRFLDDTSKSKVKELRSIMASITGLAETVI